MSITIEAWVDGSVQEIDVEEITTYLGEDAIEDKLNNIKTKITTITLPVEMWLGATSPYYQEISLNVTSNTMVDLQPTPEQLMSWQDDGLAFTVTNDDGVVKVHVSGGLPTEDLTVQVKLQEVFLI